MQLEQRRVNEEIHSPAPKLPEDTPALPEDVWQRQFDTLKKTIFEECSPSEVIPGEFKIEIYENERYWEHDSFIKRMYKHECIHMYSNTRPPWENREIIFMAGPQDEVIEKEVYHDNKDNKYMIRWTCEWEKVGAWEYARGFDGKFKERKAPNRDEVVRRRKWRRRFIFIRLSKSSPS